jgi:hypothetical protein
MPGASAPGFVVLRPATAGWVEVLSDNTLLLRLESPEPQDSVAEEDSLMLGLFRDFLSRQALSSDQGPVLYSEAMAALQIAVDSCRAPWMPP